MSSSLKDLLAESAALENQLVETAGELTEELETSLMQLEIKIPEKISRYMSLLDRLEMESDNLYSKAKKYEMAAKSLTGLKERLTANVKFQMIENQLQELRGENETFSLSKGKPSVVISDITKVPRAFVTQTISEQADKNKLRECMERGEIIPGASLQDTAVLRRKINKGIK